VRVGPAGWSYRDWEGVVYPFSRTKSFDQLAYLARFFDLIEVNSTFYRPPSARSSLSWLRRTSFKPEFRFTVKLFRNYTHDPEALKPEEEEQWKTGVKPLQDAGKLGAVLAQFPYSFHCTEENREYLTSLRQRFRTSPLVVEIRHRSWDRPETFRFFQEIGVAFCNIDQPQVSYSTPPTDRVTSEIAYVRLHGRNVRDWFRKDAGRDARYNYLYSETELEEWSKRIRDMQKQVREIYVVANNHYQGQAVCNSLQLKAGLEHRRIPVPAQLLPFYPQLKKIQKEK
jgi:uncharacterized protein YecE (DUF72 family)